MEKLYYNRLGTHELIWMYKRLIWNEPNYLWLFMQSSVFKIYAFVASTHNETLNELHDELKTIVRPNCIALWKKYIYMCFIW